MGRDDAAPVWRALADTSRRRILDLLRERPRTTGEVAAEFEISRIAVMRHLGVLAEADLLVSRKRGRERWHYPNAIPLLRLGHRWLDPVATGWAVGLDGLRRELEAEGDAVSNLPSVDLAFDVSVAATPTEVFAGLTVEPGAWWGHPFLRPHCVGLALEAELGGQLVEQWDDGGGLLATVTGWAPDRHLQLSGPFHLGVVLGRADFDLAPEAGGTRLEFGFRAFGPVDEDLADRFAGGWRELVTARLKTYVETGTRLGIAAAASDEKGHP